MLLHIKCKKKARKSYQYARLRHFSVSRIVVSPTNMENRFIGMNNIVKGTDKNTVCYAGKSIHYVNCTLD